MKQDSEAAALQEQVARLGIALADEQLGKLLQYERMLRIRAVPLGLIAEGDVDLIRSRHLLDSIRAAPLTAGAEDAYDLGSGAGLPGIVVAIARPDLRVGLVDSRGKRIAFLELAVEQLDLPNASIHAVRAESLTQSVDLCMARAFAPAPRAWRVAERLLRPGGRLIYFAGLGEEAEARIRGLPSDTRVLNVPGMPVLESAGPLVIMARQ